MAIPATNPTSQRYSLIYHAPTGPTCRVHAQEDRLLDLDLAGAVLHRAANVAAQRRFQPRAPSKRACP